TAVTGGSPRCCGGWAPTSPGCPATSDPQLPNFGRARRQRFSVRTRHSGRRASRDAHGGAAMEMVRDGSVLVLEGPLDGRCTFEVRTALYDHLASYDDVVVAVAEVGWIDASALRMLAVATRLADRGGREPP